MPIRPENRQLYPDDWKRIADDVKHDAGWCCEECFAEHGEAHPETGSLVVLTVAHLDHDPTNCKRENLRAWCQKCHNSYDAPMRAAGIKQRRRKSLDQFQETLEL